MNAADLEAPGIELLDQLIERISELREDQELLVRLIEKALLMQQIPKLCQLPLGAEFFDFLCLRRDPSRRQSGRPSSPRGERAPHPGRQHYLLPLQRLTTPYCNEGSPSSAWAKQGGETAPHIVKQASTPKKDTFLIFRVMIYMHMRMHVHFIFMLVTVDM